jgi:hypothetical protein
MKSHYKAILIFFLSLSFIFGEDKILLPLKYKDKCYIFSSLTGEKLAYFSCEEIGKQSKDLIPVKFNGKWGYVNERGEWLIKPEYDYADNFYSELARVEKDHKYGFIDKKGNIVINFSYIYAGNFLENDLAPVQCDNKHNFYYGYINKKGEMIIPCEFQTAYEFRNNIARTRKWDLYGYIFYDKVNNRKAILQNFQFRLAGDFGSNYTYVLKEKGFAYIKPDGQIKKILEPYIIPDNFSFTDPLAKIQNLNIGWYGYIDKEFKEVIPTIFLNAEEFYLGFAKVLGPPFYQNIHVEREKVLKFYKESLFEEFFIDVLGRRITFWD